MGRVMNRKLACFSRLCVLVVSTISAYGQATTSVRGRITDPSGAAIPSAQVQLTRPDTNFSRHTEVNNEGVYEFLQLPRALTRFRSARPVSSRQSAKTLPSR